jgi:hypothetical protein
MIEFERMASAAKEFEASGGTMFYRCMLCAHVVSPWDIRERHGCPKCAGTKIKPSNLSLLEKVLQVLKHPRVWAWPRG